MGSCHYNVINKNTGFTRQRVGAMCFGGLQSQYDQKNTIVLPWRSRDEVIFKPEEVKTYIDELNKIPELKIGLDLDDPDKYIFILDTNNFDNKIWWLTALTVVRYVWERDDEIYSKFPDIVKGFLKLNEIFPEEDTLYKLIWAHHNVEKTKYWYGSHAMIEKVSTDFYPVKYADIVLSRFGSINNTFTINKPFPYSKTIKEYESIVKGVAHV